MGRDIFWHGCTSMNSHKHPMPPQLTLLQLRRESPVTQNDLQKAAYLQVAAWLAERAAREYAETLAQRIHHGAAVELGPLVFDYDLQMARRRIDL